MTNPQQQFLKITLSGLADDVEIVGGDFNAINAFTLACNSKGFSFEVISKEDAKKALESIEPKAACGFFIEDGVDLLKDEERRAEANDLLYYLNVRLGMGSLFHSFGI